MSADLMEKLEAIDPAILTEVVRQDRGDPELVLLDWTVSPLSHEKIIDTTGGLFCFNGQSQGEQGIQSWKVVLKCINNPKQWGQEPRNWSYWKREVLAFHSGFLGQLPVGVRAPRCYGVVENEDGTWVWLEYIQESTSRQWSLEHFQRAARQLGRFQGAYLNGTPLVDLPWLSQFFTSVWGKDDFWLKYMDPAVEENAWQSPITQRGWDDRQKSRVLQLISERVRFFEANQRLPQVLCHNDAHRRNWMWTRSAHSGAEELIGIDWAFCGVGALGNDLGELVGSSLYFFDYHLQDVEAFEAAQMEGYLAGLTEVGVEVDPRLTRLGYLISLSFWMGAMLPGWAALMLPPESGTNVQAMYGHSVEEVLAGWVQLDAFCLDRADEARALIRQVGL